VPLLPVNGSVCWTVVVVCGTVEPSGPSVVVEAGTVVEDSLSTVVDVEPASVIVVVDAGTVVEVASATLVDVCGTVVELLVLVLVDVLVEVDDVDVVVDSLSMLVDVCGTVVVDVLVDVEVLVLVLVDVLELDEEVELELELVVVVSGVHGSTLVLKSELRLSPQYEPVSDELCPRLMSPRA
jgi:hypothetical protein